jgi:hypothetical protein
MIFTAKESSKPAGILIPGEILVEVKMYNDRIAMPRLAPGRISQQQCKTIYHDKKI